MPPASRGLQFQRILRHYATSRPPPAQRPSRLPADAGPAPSTARSLPSSRGPTLPPQQQQPQRLPLLKPRHDPNYFRIVDDDEPVTPKSFTAPDDPRPLLERLLSRLPPRLRVVIRFAFRLLPWIPPGLLLIIHFPLQIMDVNGESMSPFLNANFSNNEPNTNDFVVVDRFFEKKDTRESALDKLRTGKLERGMVVVFPTPHNPNQLAVKRIVGLPGDKVQPLPGYAGVTDNPPQIVVPWNHIWVEGDVNDRNKSVDSNWYGPVSKTLVIGQVRYVLKPWYSPTTVHWQEQSYPAQKRVEKDAVFLIDPDELHLMQSFAETAPLALQNLRLSAGKLDPPASSPQKLREWKKMYSLCQRIKSHPDPKMAEVAEELGVELEKRLGIQGHQEVAQADLKALVNS